MSNLISILAVTVSVGLACVPAAVEASVSSVVVDAGTGRTLQANDADRPRYPASLTKMMTLYLLYDALARGKIKMSTRMRVSRRAASMPPTKLGLRPGAAISVRDAILALTTKSANDVAVVVAEALAGSESRFARRMTEKARALGMRHTTFRNASGLHHPQQKTTARDMAVLGRALVRDHPKHYRHFAARMFVYRQTRYHNHNGLLATYRGVDGIKTGYTRAAGYNLVASAKRGRTRLIGVVMGSSSSAARSALMTNLLDLGFHRAPPATKVTATRAHARRGAAKARKPCTSKRCCASSKRRSSACSSKRRGARK
jgi:D-alanyl-D-alanine carboxypeptidase